MGLPTLAFAIPTKGRHGPLRRTLASVARAAAVAGARVVICDQSPEPFAEPGPWLVDHAPHLGGLPAARNRLLGLCPEDVVCYLDDDVDLGSETGTLLRQLAATEPEVAGWGAVVETRPRSVQRLHRLAFLGSLRDPRRLLHRRCDGRTAALFGCCFAVRRGVICAIGGFDARRPGYALGEDLDACLRLTVAGHHLRFVAALRCHHRRDGADRADPVARGRAKARFLRWLARRHGGGNPATPLHLALALAAAASGRGNEPASWRGVLAGLG